MPDFSFVMLDDHAAFGGTWITHRFPGVRSDSDLFTYGYSFKPWTGPPVATAAEILEYLSETIDEHALAPYIRYRHRVVSADWSNDCNRWRVTVRHGDGGMSRMSARFLLLCQGYYRHDEGYTPTWPGMDDFQGRIVHPQAWPDDLDCAGKRIVVVGSGATAATIVPALADAGSHVTMVQRSPSYYFSGSNTAPMIDELRDLGIDEHWIYEIARRKFLREDAAFMERIRANPDAVARELIEDVRARLGPGHDIETHFTPAYRPWQQRLCLIPNGDLLEVIRAGKARIATGEIERFTPTGLRLKSGEEFQADIIVTATGLNLGSFGDLAFTIDGEPVCLAETVAFHGMMFSGVPNLAWVFGYLRSSWTLRVELVADVVCRLLNHMRVAGLNRVTPVAPDEDEMRRGPWVDPDEFNPGYIRRGAHLMPKRGDRPEWQHSHDYWVDKERLPAIAPDDPALSYA